MLLEEANSILDIVLNTEYANQQKTIHNGKYTKENITSVSEMRLYQGNLEKQLHWFVYINFGYTRVSNSKYDSPLHIKIPVDDEIKRKRLLNALHLHQDHLYIDNVNPDIGI